MGNSYPDRTNARGIWNVNEISKNYLTKGTFPISGTRGLIGGGCTSPDASTAQASVDYLTIPTTGNAADFGDLNDGLKWGSACSSFTRGIFGGGEDPSNTTIVNYIGITALGDGSDFGDLTVARRFPGATSNTVRGVFAGGDIGSDSDVIDYLTIAATGNLIDFGNLSSAREGVGAVSSSTRSLFAGGQIPAEERIYIIRFLSLSM